MSQNNKDKLYIVMNTFSGEYLKESSSKNIGHENINFFSPKTRKSKNIWFLWLNHDGILNDKYRIYDGKINLLMVTNDSIEKDKYIILARADNCKIVNGSLISGQNKENREKRYNEFIKEFPDVKYGKKRIQDIYKNNIDKKMNNGINTLATFFTENKNICVPKETTKIVIKDCANADIKQNMANERMRMFIKDNISFEQLINNIEWIGIDKKRNILPSFKTNCSYYSNKESFLTILKKEKDELALSNIISYSLSNSKKLMKEFIKYITKFNISLNNEKLIDYYVIRENKNIDITLKLKNANIIIENKVSSKIVAYKDKETFIESIKATLKEDDLITEENAVKNIKEQLKETNVNTIYSQLAKYYLVTQIENSLSVQKKNIYYFLLVPEYAKNYFINIINNENYIFAKHFIIITYCDMFKIFKKVLIYPYRKDILTEIKLLSSNSLDANVKAEVYKFLKKAGYKK